MTDAFVGWLIIGGLVVVSMLFKRKKTPPKPSGIVFIEVVEIFEIRKRAKAPRFLVNMVIAAVIVAFIWAANH